MTVTIFLFDITFRVSIDDTNNGFFSPGIFYFKPDIFCFDTSIISNFKIFSFTD